MVGHLTHKQMADFLQPVNIEVCERVLPVALTSVNSRVLIVRCVPGREAERHHGDRPQRLCPGHGGGWRWRDGGDAVGQGELRRFHQPPQLLPQKHWYRTQVGRKAPFNWCPQANRHN